MAGLVLHQNPVTPDIKLVNARKTKKNVKNTLKPNQKIEGITCYRQKHHTSNLSLLFLPHFFLHLIPKFCFKQKLGFASFLTPRCL